MSRLLTGWPAAGTSVPDWLNAVDDRTIGVVYGALRFRTDRSLSDDGYVLTLARLSGWWEPAPDATDTTMHGSGDGTVPGMLRYGARTIELRGLIRGRDQGQVLEAKGRIARARRGEIVVNERGLGFSRTASVRRIDVTYTDHSPTISSYTLTLLADDPLRYSTLTYNLQAGAQQIMNRGDETAWPILDVAGPHEPIDIIHPTGTWTLLTTPPGVTRTVDLRDGDVWQGGVRLFQADMGPAPIVRAGGSQWIVSGLWGPGQLRAVVRRFEAWS